MYRHCFAALNSLLLCAACSMGHDLSPADVASYQQLTADLAQVQTYRSAVAGMTSNADCAAALQHYLSRVRPDVNAMTPLARRLGDQMMGMGARHAGDMACGMDLISRELDRHAGVACVSADVEANRAEGLQHCDQMQQFSDHMRMRGAEAGEMMGSSMMGSGMGGSCGWQPDGGWMMSDGGMMQWDHQIPGCAGNGG